MQNITIDNYEVFVIDYIDGILSPELATELILFAEQHPHLEIDLEGLTEISSAKESISFNLKHKLKKGEILPNAYLDELLIADLHQESSGIQKKELKKLLLNQPQLKKVQQQYAKIILEPDTSIIYSNKNELKRGGIIRSLYFKWAAAAMIIVSLGWVSKQLFTKQKSREGEFSATNPIRETTEIKDSVVSIPLPVTTTKESADFLITNKKRLAIKIPVNKKLINVVRVQYAVESKDSAASISDMVSQINQSREEPVINLLATSGKEDLFIAEQKNQITALNVNPEELKMSKSEKSSVPRSKNKLFRLARIIASSYNKLTGKNSSTQRIEKDCFTQYSLAFGGFEIEINERCK